MKVVSSTGSTGSTGSNGRKCAGSTDGAPTALNFDTYSNYSNPYNQKLTLNITLLLHNL